MSTTRPSRAAVRTSARDRAREARLALDAERARRDEKIEDAAAQFFDALDERAEVLAQLERLDTAMGAAVDALTALGESTSRISALLDIDAKELRRLRPTTERKTAATTRPAHPSVPGAGSAPSGAYEPAPDRPDASVEISEAAGVAG